MTPTNYPKRFFIIGLFAIILSSGIIPHSNATPQHVVLPNELRELVNTNRQIALPTPVENLAEMVSSFQTPNLTAETDEATAQRIVQARESGNERPVTITHEQIISELDFLFNLLRYGYGAYQYFGGDDVFLPLKQSMIAQLSQMCNPVDVGFYTATLRALLRNAIADNHFWLDGRSIGIRSQLYMNEDFILHQTENGFITEIDGQTHRFLRATLNEQAVKGILPTLTKKGEFAWAFGYIVYNLPPVGRIAPSINLTVALTNTATNVTSNRIIQLHSIPNASGLSTDTYSISYAEGVTVLSNRRLRDNDQSVLQSFAETGAELRNEPILIVDLRGNGGGSDMPAMRWVHQHTGQMPRNVFAGSHFMSLTVNQLSPHMSTASPPQWHQWGYSEVPTIQNDNLVIVLIDNAIGSSGETFVGALRQLENVLFVGTNTMGCLVTGNVGNTPLPYSRAHIAFGTSFSLRFDLSPFEGVGFAPDLWVPPNASLERVLMFANNLDYVSITITRADTDVAAFEFIDSFVRNGIENVSLGDFESYEITNVQRRGNQIIYTVRATHVNGAVTYTFRIDAAGIISAFSYVAHLHMHEQIAVNFIETLFGGDVAGAISMLLFPPDFDAGEENLQELQENLQEQLNQAAEVFGGFVGFTITDVQDGIDTGSTRFYFTIHYADNNDWPLVVTVNHEKGLVSDMSN